MKNNISTKQQILIAATALAQQYGLNAFSYLDLSEIVGIAKASIHYHFPSKTDLACAILINYGEQFFNLLDIYKAEEEKAYKITYNKHSSNNVTLGDNVNNEVFLIKLIDYYISAFRQTALNENKICLCLMYATDYINLDVASQIVVKKFYIDNENWLFNILHKLSNHNKNLTHSNTILFFSTLQGLVVRNRIIKDITEFDKAVKQLKRLLVE